MNCIEKLAKDRSALFAFRMIQVTLILYYTLIFFVSGIMDISERPLFWFAIAVPAFAMLVDLAVLASHSFRGAFADPWTPSLWVRVSSATLVTLRRYFMGVSWSRSKLRLRQAMNDFREGMKMLNRMDRIPNSESYQKLLLMFLRERNMEAARSFFGTVMKKQCQREEMIRRAHLCWCAEEVTDLLDQSEVKEAEKLLNKMRSLRVLANKFEAEAEIGQLVRTAGAEAAEARVGELCKKRKLSDLREKLLRRVNMADSGRRSFLRAKLEHTLLREYGTHDFRKALYELEQALEDAGG